MDSADISGCVRTLPEQPWRPLTTADVSTLEQAGLYGVAAIAQRYVDARQRRGRLLGRLDCLRGRHDWQPPEEVRAGELYCCARCRKDHLIARAGGPLRTLGRRGWISSQ